MGPNRHVSANLSLKIYKPKINFCFKTVVQEVKFYKLNFLTTSRTR